MKSNLITSAIVFVAGAIVAFIASNMILPGIDDFDIKTIDVDGSSTLSDPDIEVFNYRAINPTVEVYVGGDCETYDENGNCLDDDRVLTPEENTPNENIPENNTENNENNEEETDNPPEENDNGTTD